MPQAAPPALPESFCKRVEASLFVRVMNQGSGPAGPSMTAVEFEDLGRFSEPTVILASGQSTELRFTIPEGCFGPGAGEICNFTITVDDMAVVAESNEGNNVANGSCGIALGGSAEARKPLALRRPGFCRRENRRVDSFPCSGRSAAPSGFRSFVG